MPDIYAQLDELEDQIPDFQAGSYEEFINDAPGVTITWRLIRDFESLMSSGGFRDWMGSPSSYHPDHTIERLEFIECDSIAESLTEILSVIFDYPTEFEILRDKEDFITILTERTHETYRSNIDIFEAHYESQREEMLEKLAAHVLEHIQ